jgi:NitT/TauT family transport system substrate-binding protein
VDLMVGYASNFIVGLDKGEAATLLAGVHVGCSVLFGHEGVHGIADLKGKTVGVPAFGTGPELLLSLMTAEVGLDPKKDLRWIADPRVKPKDLFIEGRIDAFLSFPPEPQELRARHIGRVIFDTTVDRPCHRNRAVRLLRLTCRAADGRVPPEMTQKRHSVAVEVNVPSGVLV